MSYAGYATTSAGWGEIESLSGKDEFAEINEADQKGDAKEGKIYGIYPAPKASNS